MAPSLLIYRLGATIGLVGGAAFVLANRGALPSVPALVALVLWAVLAVVAVWVVWLRRRVDAGSPMEPTKGAGAVYGASCLGMVVLIVVGARLMSASGHATGIPALVAIAVGLHFLPFARAFRAPFFTGLGLTLAGIGAAGVVAELVAGAPWGAAAAVLAGLTMTGLVAADALRHG